jgi:hypothetical protein
MKGLIDHTKSSAFATAIASIGNQTAETRETYEPHQHSNVMGSSFASDSLLDEDEYQEIMMFNNGDDDELISRHANHDYHNATVDAEPARAHTDAANSFELRTISLRQWIQHMLQFIGNDKCAAIQSEVYLKSAIKIAVALARQVAESKRGALTHAAHDWAKHAVVYVRENTAVYSDQKVSAVECNFN